MKTPENYMQRCFQLAKNGLGHTSPNPLVGSVIVYDGQIIGEGFHRQYGGPHAEVFAINSVKNQSLLKRSTLYVNLEPCSHFGKTPPCADLIIAKGIPEVVMCNIDQNPVVAGNGIRKLEEAGIKVKAGVLKEDGYELNRRFFTFIEKKRPYIILKWAQSLDGFIGKKNEEIAISNAYTRSLVHKWRSEEMAVMVGTNTAMVDNPNLNTRDYYGKDPIRITIDRQNRLHSHLNLLDSKQETLIFQTDNLNEILSELYNKKISSMIIEGGQKLLTSFIEENLWDEARVIVSDKILSEGIKAPIITSGFKSDHNLAGDKIAYYTNF